MSKSLKAVTLLIALSSLSAYAEDSGGDGGQLEPVSYDVSEVSNHPMSCKEARETAWFLRELSRSDGDTNPEVPYIPCEREGEVLAGSTVDAD